ncbi:DNA cytosine methyltransferase [Sorangium sp. So ce448]|uniref:DNA cytosine methyltransferase n=1 Tax=Sorangium sp. So ce448 TaxID=3133314 RepID=UPI003F6192B3
MDGVLITPPTAASPAKADLSASPFSCTTVDLFCGAGGLSYAFHNAGFRILAAVEKDCHAAATYEKSFVRPYSPNTHLLASDIREQRIITTLKALRTGGGRIDIIIGGPPCQDFSPARLKRRRRGHRTGLVQQYFEILQALKPRAFLFENVPGLRTAVNGKYWQTVVSTADDLGYVLNADVLHAEDFGVPQRRHRLFVVGLRKSMGKFVFPRGAEKPPTVAQIIGQLPRIRAGEASDDPMHRARRHRPETVEYLAHIPQGGAWRQAKERRVLDCHKKHNGHYDVYGRMRADDISPTITGGCTNPSKGRFIHPEQHRGLTVREAALLQTFPSDWYFCGGIESQSLQVGNAVPIKLGESLARALKAVLVSTTRR